MKVIIANVSRSISIDRQSETINLCLLKTKDMDARIFMRRSTTGTMNQPRIYSTSLKDLTSI